MKLKIVVVDLEISPWAKRWALRVGLPLLFVGAASVAFAAPTLKVWKANDALTAADLNANFSALDGRLASLEAASPTKSAFLAHQTSAQDFPSGLGQTLILDSSDFDLGSEYSPTTGTFTTTTGGLYAVTCQLAWDASSSAELISVRIWVNQNTYTGIEQTIRIGGDYATIEAHGMIRLTKSDTLNCQGYQNSGGTLSSYIGSSSERSPTRFSAIRLSP